jgi:hypothetical protein
VWFKSEAFVEYLELLGFKKAFYIREYRKAQEGSGVVTDYRMFLLLNHNCFFVRLITCPLCTTTWLALAFSSVLGWFYFPFLVVLAYILYGGIDKLYEENI